MQYGKQLMIFKHQVGVVFPLLTLMEALRRARAVMVAMAVLAMVVLVVATLLRHTIRFVLRLTLTVELLVQIADLKQ